MFNLELPEGFDGRFFRQKMWCGPAWCKTKFGCRKLMQQFVFSGCGYGYRDRSCRFLFVGHELLSSEALEMVEAEGLQENAWSWEMEICEVDLSHINSWNLIAGGELPRIGWLHVVQNFTQKDSKLLWPFAFMLLCFKHHQDVSTSYILKIHVSHLPTPNFHTSCRQSENFH